MPWVMSWQALLVVAVVAFVFGVFFGAGFVLGSWLMNQVINRPPPPPR